MAESIALNIDCMEYMATLPDNAFDLAIVDPPYGDGNGGKATRYGGMFDAIYGKPTRSQSVQVERESHTEPQYNRFGGWFEKYKPCIENGRDMGGEIRKKSLRGTLPLKKNTLTSFFVSHATK